MKCISLWQPWASLMAIGAKRIETRSWSTWHRGLLAIHAAKKWSRELEVMTAGEPFVSCLRDERELPMGAIVCLVNLRAIHSTGDIFSRINSISVQERAFGDYSPGRYGWVTDGVYRLPRPIPYRGAQGVFDVPDAVVGEAIEAWKAVQS